MHNVVFKDSQIQQKLVDENAYGGFYRDREETLYASEIMANTVAEAEFAMLGYAGSVNQTANSGDTPSGRIKSIKQKVKDLFNKNKSNKNISDVKPTEPPKTTNLITTSKKVTPKDVMKIENNFLDKVEAPPGQKGPHTLDRHVGKTNQELIQRAAREKTAIDITQSNIRKHANEVAEWLNNPNASERLIIETEYNYIIGRGVEMVVWEKEMLLLSM